MRRVLVVDDLPDAADSMAALLYLYGYDCEAQLSGVAALASARSQRPDIVLLDLCMPRMDGFEFVRRFREVEGCDRTPILIISGFHIPESRVRPSPGDSVILHELYFDELALAAKNSCNCCSSVAGRGSLLAIAA